MPVYEYECENCSCRFEVKQRFDEKSQAKCPKCKSVAKRVFIPVPIIFKGTGFYVTDHRGGNTSTLSNPKSEDKPAETVKKKAAPKSSVDKAE